MTDNIVSIAPKTDAIGNALVVAMLEQALDEARKGTLTAVAISAVDAAGATHTWIEHNNFISTLTGSVSYLMHRLNRIQEHM